MNLISMISIAFVAIVFVVFVFDHVEIVKGQNDFSSQMWNDGTKSNQF